MAEQWFCAIDNGQQGPFSAEQVRALLRDGRVDEATPVWRAGMAGWAALRDQPELRDGAATLAPTAAATLAPVGRIDYAQPSPGEGAVLFTPRAAQLLHQSGRWAMPFALLTTLGAGASLIGLLVTALSGSGSLPMAVAMLATFAGYAGLSIKLWQFALRSARLARMRREDVLESTLQAQRDFWRLAAILAIVAIALWCAAIAAAFLFGA